MRHHHHGDLASVGDCDLAWAAMAVHHAEDEVATVGSIGSLLRPDGLLCLLERADPMEIRLADELGRPGIWDRLAVAQSAWSAHARPVLPAERYAEMLGAAGLAVVEARTLIDTVAAPDDAATVAVLARHLKQMERTLADVAERADLDVLSEADLHGASVTSSRLLFIARRPVSSAASERTRLVRTAPQRPPRPAARGPRARR